MGRKIKITSVILSVVMCLSAFTMSVMAADVDMDGYDDETGEYIGVVTDPAPVVTDPPYVAPTEPYVPETDPPYVAPTEEYYEPETTPQYDYDDSDYNDTDNDSSSDVYVGGGQTYTTPISTAPSVALYNSDGSIDEDTLSSNDWNDIAANLKAAGSSDSDSDDFSFMQTNNSKSDNGDWMLIVGIICLLLSASGIAYLIASSVMRRKKLKNGGKPQAPYGKRPATATAGYSRSRDEYNDGYRQPTKSEIKNADKRRKFDTAEVRIQKSSQNGNRYKNNGGKRYK